ncbi:MAG: hypothetical protein LUD76_10185 [Alistipes sp.]|nr:hypothetical protein [Alistipes sp.]
MEKFNRKPDLGPVEGRETTLPDGTHIQRVNCPVRQLNKLENNKALSDVDRGYHLIAMRLLVNKQPITFDDLMDCFNDDELQEIGTKLFPELSEEGGAKNS